MRFIALVVLVVGVDCNPSAPAVIAPPPPQPRACFSICSSSIECSGGVLQRCPFCNFGACKSTRPELLDCRRACDGVEPRPTWCDFGGCGEVMRAAAGAQ